jgi:hypothetical protein
MRAPFQSPMSRRGPELLGRGLARLSWCAEQTPVGGPCAPSVGGCSLPEGVVASDLPQETLDLCGDVVSQPELGGCHALET